MSKRIAISIAACCFVVTWLSAQNIQFAREIIDSLCSEQFHGRGYVHNGDGKAAKFIAKKFEAIGLKAFGNDYFQPFDVSVNTLPNQLSLSVNDQLLVPGVDYHMAPSSPSVNGDFKTLYLSEKILLDWKKMKKTLKNKQSYFLIVDEQQVSEPKNIRVIHQHIQKLVFSDEIQLGGIALLSEKKLTWHTSTKQGLRPQITIKNNITIDELKTIDLMVDAKFQSNYQTQNVIGYIPGSSDSVVVFSAHYDHLGRMGKDTYFPGANDNASGTALLIDLARHFSTTKPKYTMVFMAFGGEELGLLGSSYFVKNPLFPLSKIKFMLNFDIAGTGDDGIQVVNSSIYKEQFQKITSLNSQYGLLPQIKIRGESCNSDHCPFYMSGVPAFFIYTLGGIKAYHDVYDKPETLPLTEYEDYFKLMTLFVNSL